MDDDRPRGMITMMDPGERNWEIDGATCDGEGNTLCNLQALSRFAASSPFACILVQLI